jgi:putative membrane protein
MIVPAWLTTWTLDLPALLFSAGLTALYLRGARRRAEVARPRPHATRAFLVGVTVVLISHLSPVAAYSAVLYWPHMVQHLLIIVVAAPLIAWSAPVATIRFALAPPTRHRLSQLARGSRRARRRAGSPHPLVLATVAHIAVLWLWHVPPVYDAAGRAPALHLAEHATFLAAAVWFWSEVRHTARRSPRTQAIATLCLGAMIVQGGVLGAVITFASRSLYDVYDGYGILSAIEDQQLAGALMWVPPGFVYASFAIRRFIGWFDLVGGNDPAPAVPSASTAPAPVRPERDRPVDGGRALAHEPGDPPR